MPTAFELWKAELLIVGNIIQDGDAAAPPAQQTLIAAFIAQEEDDGWFEHCPGVLGHP